MHEFGNGRRVVVGILVAIEVVVVVVFRIGIGFVGEQDVGGLLRWVVVLTRLVR